VLCSLALGVRQLPEIVAVPRLRREFAPFIGYVGFVVSVLLCFAAALLYNPEYIDFAGLVLPALALPWGFLALGLGEAPLWWSVVCLGGIAANSWLLWRDGRARVARRGVAGPHRDAAV